MKIVVGLGNFGEKYAKTFHNVGFITIDALVKKLNAKFDMRECDSETATVYRNGEKIILAKPLTYMNLSGVAVKQLVKKYKAETEDVIVIFDDIDLEPFTVRIRSEGSGGTHNGMRNVIECLDTKNIPRVRIGIGKPSAGFPLADYVLSRIPSSYTERLNAAVETATEEIMKMLDNPVK